MLDDVIHALAYTLSRPAAFAMRILLTKTEQRQFMEWAKKFLDDTDPRRTQK